MCFPKNYRYKDISLNILVTEILELFEFVEFYDRDYKNIKLADGNMRLLL